MANCLRSVPPLVLHDPLLRIKSLARESSEPLLARKLGCRGAGSPRIVRLTQISSLKRDKHTNSDKEPVKLVIILIEL